MLVERAEIISEYNKNTGKITMVETLRTELSSGDNDEDELVRVGYADVQGWVVYGDIDVRNVSQKEWFQTGLKGESDISLSPSQDASGHSDVLISLPAYIDDAISGVLFAILPNRAVSNLIETTAYDGKAVSGVCDADGNVIFTEKEFDFSDYHENVFNLMENDSLENGFSQAELKQVMRNGEAINFYFHHEGEKYYAAIEPLGIRDWYMFSTIGGTTADTIQRHVSAYVSAMFIIVFAVGIAMILEAFLHERTTVKRLEQDKELLRQSSARHTLINRLSNEVLFTVNMEEGSIVFNDNFESMFGFSPPACSLDNTEECYNLVVENDRPLLTRFIEQIRSGAAEAHEELRMIGARGIGRWKRLEIYTVFDSEGHSKEAVGKISDIHRQKQSLQRLRKQADSDSLTGLLNRSAMERYTRAVLADEGDKAKHAFFMLDFDNFKQVNDTLGHAEGDQMLVAFAYALKRLFRAGDLVARIGGDEYTMLMKTIDSDESALEKAEQIRKAMGRVSEEFGVDVTVSIGIAVFDRDGKTFEALYKAADEALYSVKNSGKDDCAFCNAADAKKRSEQGEMQK
jgi:diguanylate cyclase (GGDEF)-like protein/PAS domain S-box-containing protein